MYSTAVFLKSNGKFVKTHSSFLANMFARRFKFFCSSSSGLVFFPTSFLADPRPTKGLQIFNIRIDIIRMHILNFYRSYFFVHTYNPVLSNNMLNTMRKKLLTGKKLTSSYSQSQYIYYFWYRSLTWHANSLFEIVFISDK